MNAESIKIESEENGVLWMILQVDEAPISWPGPIRFHIQDIAKELYDTVKREIGPWLDERNNGEARLSMNTRNDYAAGFSVGEAYAQADRHEHAPFASGEAELRAEATEAAYGDSPYWWAFKLGIVRGYRDAVRTLRAGKWGT